MIMHRICNKKSELSYEGVILSAAVFQAERRIKRASKNALTSKSNRKDTTEVVPLERKDMGFSAAEVSFPEKHVRSRQQ
jgi:hypothetical protein